MPEYVNFWQGKPLSKREYSIPVHTRMAWTRPKSDYGSRITVHKSNANTLATVVEGVDGDREGGHSRDHTGADGKVTYTAIAVICIHV